jgi:hypothetical protein
MLTNQKEAASRKWIIGFLIAGSINYFAQQFNKSSLDELVILSVAIGAGYLYHRLKLRIQIKNGAARGIVTYLILLVISAVLIGFITGIVNASR